MDKSVSDVELLDRMKNGSGIAFTELYNRYWDKLYIVAGNKLQNHHLAQEIVQDIFLDLWKRRESLNVPGSFSIYLAAALKYKIINARIQLKKYVTVPETEVDNKDFYSLDQQLSFDELRGRLSELVANLPQKCRLVYILSREDGLSYKEIAQRLDISIKTVETHLSKALKIIRSGVHRFIFFIFL